MTDDRVDAIDLAEEYIARGERGGLRYNTPEERATAKLAIAEQFRKEQKQGQVGESAAAVEGGGVLGAGRPTSHEAIAEEIEAERRKPATAASMARRKKLRGQLDDAIGDVQVTFTRG